MSDLRKRHDTEEVFHDRWAKDISVGSLLVRESFEAETAVENRAALQNFGELNGKRILDLGCGAGETSVYFAMKGGDVFAVDISNEMLKRALELSERYGVKLKAFKMEAEVLQFEDGYFDFVFGNGVLHHVDVKLAVSEISRVLKKGGKAAFIEPLGYNPAINIYRKIAKDVRSESERPFNYSYLKHMKNYFSEIRYRNFWLFSLVIFAYMYLVERVDPAVDRYWKRVIRESERYKKAFRFFHRLDEAVLAACPFLGRFCWNIVLILKK